MAHHPQQSTSSFRSRRDDTGSLEGSDIDHQQHQSPPSLPLFSTTSSDHTITNSSTLSSKSGSSDGGSGTAANMLNNHNISSNTVTPSAFKGAKRNSNHNSRRKLLAQDTHNRALCKKALMQNDSMVYLGAYIYKRRCVAILFCICICICIHSFLLLKFCCPALSMLSSRWTTGIYLWKL